MKIATKPPQKEWMPEQFRRLQLVCLKHAAKKEVTPMSWGMSINGFPEPHVKLLSSAASKYRLAYHSQGLLGPEDDGVAREGIGDDYFEKYSAQLLVMLSFVAFETYLRMLDTKWQKFPVRRLGLDHVELAQIIHEDLGKSSLKKLRDAMDQRPLRDRLDRFLIGDDGELLAVISALRNSFAHGKMGISKSVSLPCALKIKEFLLEAIDKDIDMICASLEAQLVAFLDNK